MPSVKPRLMPGRSYARNVAELEKDQVAIAGAIAKLKTLLDSLVNEVTKAMAERGERHSFNGHRLRADVRRSYH